jgi:hypothetical protein
VNDLLISHWNGFNRSTGFHYDRQPGEPPLAKKHEISWNGYPLPMGVRITDIDSSAKPPSNGQNTYDSTEEKLKKDSIYNNRRSRDRKRTWDNQATKQITD